jgi:3-methylfumaryl-CoA hydratase
MRIDHPVLLSQPAQKKSTIRSVDVKRGKSGALVFVTVEHAVHQGDRLCILEEQNIVYRDMPEGPSPLPPGELAPSNPDWVKTIAPDPVLLFRFSALTYNSHRIHYDRDYTVRNEYYPGLVVHGPLQATLLLDSIREHVPGKRAVQFAFRAIRPIFDTSEFKVIGHLDGNHIRLCTVDSEGFIGMTATAELA